ncbi:O-antigen ligase [Enterococcus faecalis]|uniref:O-antigen ligase family protein n=1 Tax=Enterococcus faecalis TaxID=1351 RepID=UPI002362B94D|nr:O-antigen polymerase [Enterococcus faecalis]MDT2066645.1 O-antigen ligase [Enterococcus faecalis]WDA14479.1 O-antigen ligase [Enterococcus faecalis]
MKNISRILILVFLIGNVGSFFILGTSFFVFLRYFSTVAIIGFTFFTYKTNMIHKGILAFLVMYLFIFYAYPLILISIGIYKYGINNIIINTHYYLSTFFCCLFIANFYQKNKKYNFFKDFSIIIFVFLVIGIIVFKDVSLNIVSLLNNVLQNARSDRSYLGFNNPNQVAITVTVLVISIYFSNIKDYMKYFSYVVCLFILFNTGSRTPLFSLAITAIFMLGYIKFKHISNIHVRSIIITFLVGSLVISTLMIFNYLLTASTDFFINLDNLTTNRLGRQINTIDYLAGTNNMWFGLGMFNPSFFNSQSQFMGLHTDSYYTYCLVTTGIVGLVMNLMFICLFFFKAFKLRDRQLLITILLCIVYGAFEGTLFFPTSLLTILLLVTLFFIVSNRGTEDVVKK